AKCRPVRRAQCRLCGHATDLFDVQEPNARCLDRKSAMLAARAACRLSSRRHPLLPSRRFVANAAAQSPKRAPWTIWALAIGGGSAVFWGFQSARPLHAEAPEAEAGDALIRQKKRRRIEVDQTNWDSPGVTAWGSNSGKVIAPDSEERWIKNPRR